VSATGYHYKLTRAGWAHSRRSAGPRLQSTAWIDTYGAGLRLASWAFNFQGGCARSSAIITNSGAGGRSGPMGQKLGSVNVRGVVAMAESEPW